VQITVSELAALVGGQCASQADGSRPITGLAAISEAGEGDVTFFGNAKYLPALKKCRATAALVPADFAEDAPPVAIRVENPSLAFAQLLERFKPTPVKFAPGVHPTAVIGAGVALGEGVSIQPFAVIEEGARIGAGTVVGAHGYVGHGASVGEDCLIHPRVTIGERCEIGNRVILHSGAVIGGDGFGFEFAEGHHVKIPQIGIVQIDDDVEIGANTTIDRARFGRTWIGAGTKIDNLVQIAHNVVTGKHCIIVSHVGISGSTRLGNYVTLAGQVGVVGHIEIGDQATVGAQSGVSKSLAPRETYLGSPAIPVQQFKEQIGQIHRLPRLSARVRKLEQTIGATDKSLRSEG
jgi:UDP-3-O-[3-hydroxymyristoyl] glucosamine N-acyltransferase